MNSEEKLQNAFAEILAEQYSVEELSKYFAFLEANKPNTFPTKVARKAFIFKLKMEQ